MKNKHLLAVGLALASSVFLVRCPADIREWAPTMPEFTPAGGVYYEAVDVDIANVDPGAESLVCSATATGVYGPMPTDASPCAGSVHIDRSCVLAAQTSLAGATAQNYASYTIMLYAPIPSIEPGDIAYPRTLALSLDARADARNEIRYTLGGADPTGTSAMFPASGLELDGPVVIRAKAFRTGTEGSAVLALDYTLVGVAATPVIQPEPGFYTYPIVASASTSTDGAAITWTIDGSDPLTSATASQSPSSPATISIPYTCTLKAYAHKDLYADSGVTAAAYTITGKTAPPTFSQAAGKYTSAQSVSIACATPGSSIRYTTDGTAPSRSNGELYTGSPVAVGASVTLQACSWVPEWQESSDSSASAAYVITGIVSTPVLSSPGGTWTYPQTLSMSCATVGATIRYTIDGSTPGETGGLEYAGPITVSATSMIKAVAVKDDWVSSAVADATFVITGRAAIPSFSPVAGTYTNPQSVVVNCATPGSSIRYTTDGTAPSRSNGELYTGSLVTIGSSATLQAFAWVPAWQPTSDAAASAAYVITGMVAAPAMSLPAGTYASAQSVTLTCASEGATIRYTVNGTEPSRTNGSIYGGAILIDSSQTLRAVAYFPAWEASSDASSSAAYEITGTVATPTFSKAGGYYTNSQSVAVSTSTSGATLRYTTDGTDPVASATAVEAVSTVANISVVSDVVIKAVAVKDGWARSGVAEATYAITGFAKAPAFSVSSGVYTNSLAVSMSSATPGASIRYTTDGTAPSRTAGAMYTGAAVPISATATLKAYAWVPAWQVGSDVSSSAAYTITGMAAAPAMSVAGGTYTSTQSVALSCATPGASIRYTTNGTLPSRTVGTLYSGTPVSVPATATLRAYAWVPSWLASSDSSSMATYTITGIVATPTLSLPGGYYTASQTVVITAATGATLRYTTDGTDPAASATAIAVASRTATLTVAATATVKAVALKAAWATSSPVEASYVITGVVATPTMSPSGGTYTSAQTVAIASATPGASIRYSFDSTPSRSTGTPYTGPLTMDANKWVYAMAYVPEWPTGSDSASASAYYRITGTVETPVISLPGGTYMTSPQVATITCATSGATIYYTLDGTEPTKSSSRYTSALRLYSSQMIKAKAFMSEWADSATATAAIVIGGGVTIVPGDGSTYAITLAGAPSALEKGESRSVTASASVAVSSWAWYIDGALEQKSGSGAFLLCADIDIGLHTLTAMATTTSGATFSRSVDYRVVAAGTTFCFDDGLLPSAFSGAATTWAVASGGATGTPYSLRSPVTAYGLTSVAMLRTVVPASKTFKGLTVMFRTEGGSFGSFDISINGVGVTGGYSGERDWMAFTKTGLSIAGGTPLVIEFTYKNTSSAASDEDAVAVDSIVLSFE